MATERIQKILARVGIASRRAAEEIITEGLVTVNGRLAKLGDKADLNRDAIKVRGKLLQQPEEPVYLAFHKPKGVISTVAPDPQGRPTLAGYISKVKARVFPIGKLHFNTEGLLLLTNDGHFTDEYQKRSDIPHVYHAKIKGHPDTAMIAALERGARVGRKLIKPNSVRATDELANKTKLEIVFLGSAALDVKSLLETKGFLLERLQRTAIGQVTLHGLEPGQFRYLKRTQVEALLEQPELGMRLIEKAEEKDAKKFARLEIAAARKEKYEEWKRSRPPGRVVEPKPAAKYASKPTVKPLAKPASRSTAPGSKPARPGSFKPAPRKPGLRKNFR